MTEDHAARQKAAVTEQRLNDHEELCSHRFQAVQAVQEETNEKIDRINTRTWWILGILLATALGVAAKVVSG